MCSNARSNIHGSAPFGTASNMYGTDTGDCTAERTSFSAASCVRDFRECTACIVQSTWTGMSEPTCLPHGPGHPCQQMSCAPQAHRPPPSTAPPGAGGAPPTHPSSSTHHHTAARQSNCCQDVKLCCTSCASMTVAVTQVTRYYAISASCGGLWPADRR